MKKKIFSGVLLLVATAVMALGFTACGASSVATDYARAYAELRFDDAIDYVYFSSNTARGLFEDMTDAIMKGLGEDSIVKVELTECKYEKTADLTEDELKAVIVADGDTVEAGEKGTVTLSGEMSITVNDKTETETIKDSKTNVTLIKVNGKWYVDASSLIGL